MKNIKRRLINIPGWHTKRKIVVLDSDDWGSLGLPSKNVFEKIKKHNLNIENNPYLKYDSLASENDLTSLFEVLSSFKDKNGNHPVFTANTVVANPDFEKIEASNFENYYFEYFTDSLEKYPEHQRSFEMWKEGINLKLFVPQFHAREHVNVNYWMNALRSGNEVVHMGFRHRFYILDKATHPDVKYSCTSAHYPKSFEEKIEIEESTKEGLKIFEEIFGYPSTSFTGTGHIWHTDLEGVLKKEGVSYLKGIIIQREPVIGTTKFKKRIHYTGKKNKIGLIHLVRNAFFEPGLSGRNESTVLECLDRIRLSFLSNKPAIISTHRINYIGYIDKDFRNYNLQQLNLLLKLILKHFPDVEFMSSNQLGTLISEDHVKRKAFIN